MHVRCSRCRDLQGRDLAGSQGSARGSHLVGARPVGYVIDDQALGHGVLGGHIVAAAGGADVAALCPPVVVAGHQFVQHRIWAVTACEHRSQISQVVTPMVTSSKMICQRICLSSWWADVRNCNLTF